MNIMFNKRNILILVLILSFSLVSAFSIPVFPLDSSGDLQPNNFFEYQWNFTSSTDCTGVLLSNTTKITTDKFGRGHVNFSLDTMTGIPLVVCEYKNGTLRKSFGFEDEVFRNVYAQKINLTGNVNVGGSLYVDTGGSLNGTFNFGNGWQNGGSTIDNGTAYFQNIYVYNISTLDVSNLIINGSLLPHALFDNQLDIGSASQRWKICI